MADQQFCLRWNNHQNTLISVFDSLQERGCMVDCTLAAEGQSLQAHKVVLSACSPYLEDLLSKHYDKHPILLLKDVKFEELKAMMDYMYRGEVNVAQDKLATFLRAAESLQLKGLTDGGTDPPDTGGTSGAIKRTSKGAPVSVRSTQQLTVRSTNSSADNATRDGSVSPSLRKRRRRRGSDASDHDSTSNVPDSKLSVAASPVTGPSVSNQDMLPTVPSSGPSDTNLLLSSILENSETDNVTDSGLASASSAVHAQVNNVIRDKESSDLLIEPKTEYLDDDVQDLTLEEDGEMFRAGPSNARNSGNFMGDGGDDMFMGQDQGSANAQDCGEFESTIDFEESTPELKGNFLDPTLPAVDVAASSTVTLTMTMTTTTSMAVSSSVVATSTSWSSKTRLSRSSATTTSLTPSSRTSKSRTGSAPRTTRKSRTKEALTGTTASTNGETPMMTPTSASKTSEASLALAATTTSSASEIPEALISEAPRPGTASIAVTDPAIDDTSNGETNIAVAEATSDPEGSGAPSPGPAGSTGDASTGETFTADDASAVRSPPKTRRSSRIVPSTATATRSVTTRTMTGALTRKVWNLETALPDDFESPDEAKKAIKEPPFAEEVVEVVVREAVKEPPPEPAFDPETLLAQIAEKRSAARIATMSVADASRIPANSAPSQERAKTSMLKQVELYGVRMLKHVRCDKDPEWALRLLDEAAPYVEELSLLYVSRLHLSRLEAMLRLRRLHLAFVGDVLFGVPAPPVVEPWAPRSGGLLWLRVQGMPRETTLSLLSAHAPTLAELHLQVGTEGRLNWPWCCSDLHELLVQCRFANLLNVILLRDSCLHDVDGCVRQLEAIRRVLPATSVGCEKCSVMVTAPSGKLGVHLDPLVDISTCLL